VLPLPLYPLPIPSNRTITIQPSSQPSLTHQATQLCLHIQSPIHHCNPKSLQLRNSRQATVITTIAVISFNSKPNPITQTDHHGQNQQSTTQFHHHRLSKMHARAGCSQRKKENQKRKKERKKEGAENQKRDEPMLDFFIAAP
jgi:hypothetical protein